jgi:hypothetical protein
MNKRVHVAAARTLLESGQDTALPYAALELRMAMEAIAYDKLRAYVDRLPEQVLARWQAPQAIRALLEFEPHANREKRVAFGRQDAIGVPAATMHVIGETRSFDLTWLRSAYNTLGSFLHLPSPRRAAQAADPASLAKVRDTLVDILAEVDRVASATLEGRMARVVYFSCELCERTVWCNEDAVRTTKRAVCLDSSCSAVHTAEISADDEFTFLLDATDAECVECHAVTEVERRHLALGATFRCSSCSAEYEFTNVTWEYSRKAPVATSGA